MIQTVASFVGSAVWLRISDAAIRGRAVSVRAVANVLRQIANQRTVPQILEAYPYLEPADIDACLSYAALRVDDGVLALSAA